MLSRMALRAGDPLAVAGVNRCCCVLVLNAWHSGAALLAPAPGYSVATWAQNTLSSWRRQNIFRWLSRPSGSAGTANTY